MTDNTKMREAFEKWATDKGYNIERWICGDHVYANRGTQEDWEVWQAAQSEQSVPVVGDYPESVSYTDYLHLAGEDWDDDYKTIWAKLQAEVETKILWRKLAKSLCSSSITAAELERLRELEAQRVPLGILEATINLVEGLPAIDWRNSKTGMRLKDASAWAEFYCAAKNAIDAAAPKKEGE
jgi:hypothetical protein